MAIVIGTVLESSDSPLADFKDIDRAWLFSCSIIYHHIGASLTVRPGEYQLLGNDFLVLLVDVGDSVGPLQSWENSIVY